MRAPCGSYISIHALHEESDLSNQQTMQLADIFQSTLSMRRATRLIDFDILVALFQSTLSMRRATGLVGAFASPKQFQSTLSMRRATCRSSSPQAPTSSFQSTLSMRRATEPTVGFRNPAMISIHALHEESDSAAGHFCPLFETQASCLALSISNNTADTTNNMSKTSNWLSVSF